MLQKLRSTVCITAPIVQCASVSSLIKKIYPWVWGSYDPQDPHRLCPWHGVPWSGHCERIVWVECRFWLVQSRQQLESDAAELRRQVDGLKDQLDSERKKQSTFEQRISELNEKLRNAENTMSTTSHQLVQESSSLELLNKTKVRTVNDQHAALWTSLVICFDLHYSAFRIAVWSVGSCWWCETSFVIYHMDTCQLLHGATYYNRMHSDLS